MEEAGKTLWWYFHSYRRLAEEGKVKPLACPDCQTNLVTVLNRKSEDHPDLYCVLCDSRKSPGLDLLAQVRSVVGEWEL